MPMRNIVSGASFGTFVIYETRYVNFITGTA